MFTCLFVCLFVSHAGSAIHQLASICLWTCLLFISFRSLLVCLFVCLFHMLSVCLIISFYVLQISFVCLFVLFVSHAGPAIHQLASVCLWTCLLFSSFRSIYMFTCLFVCLFVCLFHMLSVCLSDFYLHTYF